MSYIPGGLETIGPVTRGNKVWIYASEDSLVDILASGYFNNALSNLKENDIIFIPTRISDIEFDSTPEFYYVRSATGEVPVKISPLGARALNGNAAADLSYNVKILSGATINHDLIIETRLFVNDVIFIIVGSGTTDDTVQVQIIDLEGNVDNVTEAIDIASAVNNQVVRAESIHVSSGFNILNVGHTLRVRAVSGSGSDRPEIYAIIKGFSLV